MTTAMCDIHVCKVKDEAEEQDTEEVLVVEAEALEELKEEVKEEEEEAKIRTCMRERHLKFCIFCTPTRHLQIQLHLWLQKLASRMRSCVCVCSTSCMHVQLYFQELACIEKPCPVRTKEEIKQKMKWQAAKTMHVCICFNDQ